MRFDLTPTTLGVNLLLLTWLNPWKIGVGVIRGAAAHPEVPEVWAGWESAPAVCSGQNQGLPGEKTYLGLTP